MQKKLVAAIAALVVCLCLATSAWAANAAGDNASSYAYNPANWPNGSNGGFGFGPWALSVSVGGAGGFFIQSSTLNGNGLDDGIVGGVAGDGDIDTTLGPSPDVAPWPPANVTDPRSWGMWNGGGVTDAIRPFTGGPLGLGQHFQVDFDNGFVPSGATVGIGLYNAANQALWEVFFVGLGGTYINNDAGGAVPTAVPYGDEGLHVDFMLTGPATYTMTLTRRDGVTQTINGNLIVPANLDQNVAEFRAFDAGNQGGSPNDFYVNSLAVPEPSSWVLAVIGLVGSFIIRRHKV